MGNLSKQYKGLDVLLAEKTESADFQQLAAEHGITGEQLSELATTLRNIEQNKTMVPTLDDYTRVRVGKLTVPKGFKRHVELLAKFAGVSEEAIWQLLMIETCALYADKYAKVVTVLNEALQQGQS